MSAAARLSFALDAFAPREDAPLADDETIASYVAEHEREAGERGYALRLIVEAEERARRNPRAKILPLRLQLHPVERGAILEYLAVSVTRGGNGKLRGPHRVFTPAMVKVLVLLIKRINWSTLEPSCHPLAPRWTIASLANATGLDEDKPYTERTIRSSLRALADLGFVVRLDAQTCDVRLCFRTEAELRQLVAAARRKLADRRRTPAPVPPCVCVGFPPSTFQGSIRDARPPSRGDGRLSPPEKSSRPGGGTSSGRPPPTAQDEALARAGVFTASPGKDDARERPQRPAAPPARPCPPAPPAPEVITPAEPAGREREREGRRGGESTRHASAPRAFGAPRAKAPANSHAARAGASSAKPEAATSPATSLSRLLDALERIRPSPE